MAKLKQFYNFILILMSFRNFLRKIKNNNAFLIMLYFEK